MEFDIEKLKQYFGKRLKEIRVENSMTQEDVSKILGTTKATISRYESGKHSPGVSEVTMLAKYFDVDFYWLAGMREEKYVKKSEFIKIPVIGEIACGTPLLAEENIIRYEYSDYNEDINFALIAKGSSMINARIYDGDIVFIRKQSDVDNGDIAVVLIDDEATLKRIYKVDGNVILHSENPLFKDMVYSSKDYKQISILGKAIAFKSRL